MSLNQKENIVSRTIITQHHGLVKLQLSNEQINLALSYPKLLINKKAIGFVVPRKSEASNLSFFRAKVLKLLWWVQDICLGQLLSNQIMTPLIQTPLNKAL